jgi:hypothetical protein
MLIKTGSPRPFLTEWYRYHPQRVVKSFPLPFRQLIQVLVVKSILRHKEEAL